MKKIFIDGQVGTTGIQIYDRLKDREDLQIISIPDEKRKDLKAKKVILNEVDLVILCLPDQAAKESVSLIENPDVKVIDASTAHRTDENWAYGLPELNKNQRGLIRKSKRVSNPGCYPTGLILAIQPLIAEGIVPHDYPVTLNALSGYSGGGKNLVETYENSEISGQEYISSRPYALGVKHKHVPEMQKYTGLKFAPIFTPSVGNFYKGMLVTIPIFTRLLSRNLSAEEVRDNLEKYYENEQFVKVMPFGSSDYLQNGFLSATDCNDTNNVELFVFDHDNQILLTARLDNLGKGASGAAVQNMNIMLGLEESKSLI